jgi:dipeptidyl aminopeptidase/acylaminoacyl peptidase
MQTTPWKDVMTMWTASPLAYANKVKTPTLFIHSLEDYNCPLSEGLQMFTALQYHDVESRMCLFPQENHELSRSGKPKHRLRRLQEMADWFDAHLK